MTEATIVAIAGTLCVVFLGLLAMCLSWRVEELDAAIRKHRAQRLDDRCWMDDQELYRVLGDGDTGDNRTPLKEVMLANCSRFIDQRCKPSNWVSYQELEKENAELRRKLAAVPGNWQN